QTNIVGTNNIYEVARLFNIKKVIYLSSGAIYGNNSDELLKENAIPNPTSFYGVSKITGEYLAEVYTKTYGMNIISLRLPFIYGPGRVMPDPLSFILKEAVKGQNTITVESFDKKLDYIYVKDVIKVIYHILQAKEVKKSV